MVGRWFNVTVLWRLETTARYRRSQQGLCKGPRNDSDERKFLEVGARKGRRDSLEMLSIACTIATGSNMIYRV